MKKIITWSIIILFLVLAGAVLFTPDRATGEHDELARCIAESGATFYGAYTCPHCDTQKGHFGASADKLPYVECATASGQGQSRECREAGIRSYPTWEFADGERVTGVLSREELASRTNCTPEDRATAGATSTDESMTHATSTGTSTVTGTATSGPTDA